MPWLVWRLSVSVERGLNYPCDWMNGRQYFPFCLLNRHSRLISILGKGNTCVVTTIDRADMRLVDPSHCRREPTARLRQAQAMSSTALPDSSIWERRPTMFSDFALLSLLYLLRWHSYSFQAFDSILIFFGHLIASPSVHSVCRKQIHYHDDLVFHYSKLNSERFDELPQAVHMLELGAQEIICIRSYLALTVQYLFGALSIKSDLVERSSLIH